MRDDETIIPEILIEQPHFLVVNKPGGLFTQAAEGIDNLETRLARWLASRDEHPGKPFVGLPHRLDRDTSGALLVARNQRALKRFGQQFQSRKIAKYYLAVVRGEVSCPSESWCDYLRKIPNRPIAEICNPDVEGAKSALLDMYCLGSDAGFSVLLMRLHTGRMHQIRVQAASRGLPILGDVHYANSSESEASNDEDSVRFMALHSLRMEFRHPQTGLVTVVTAPLAATWNVLQPSLLAMAKNCVQASLGMEQTHWTPDFLVALAMADE